MDNVKAIAEEVVTTTKVCKCCGKELPLTEFRKNPSGEGYGNTCRKCIGDKVSKTKIESSAKDERLINFTSRELIIELRNRGYKGKLTFTKEIIL